MGCLSISLLGPPQVVLAGEPVAWQGGSKILGLLAYLAAEAERAHNREFLAGLLWPNRPDRAALSSLRYALSNLRSVIGDRTAEPPFLLISRETIQLNPQANIEVDAQTFIRVLTQLPQVVQSVEGSIELLESTLTLYRGEFLAGFGLDDSPSFEEWLLFTREQLTRQAALATRRLSELFETQGDTEQAQNYVRRQLQLEPWNEEAHRRLMQLLALAGDRSAALAQYEACRRFLETEWGVAPAPETVSLATEIWQGRGQLFSPPPARQTTEKLPDCVGREAELAKLQNALDAVQTGQGQVIFVTGEAGSGKTTLLHEFACRAMAGSHDVVVAGGQCSAYGGQGVPYLPFREIVQMLSGDIEAKRAGGLITPEHSRRLWEFLPQVVQALAEDGPGLAAHFVSGEALAAHLEAFAAGGAAWAQRFVPWPPAPLKSNLAPTDLFEQLTRVLRRLAQQRRLVLLLDDLHWTDAGSVSLLFHLGQHLAGSRIFLVGAYRPSQLIASSPDTRHPLAPVINEFQRRFGEIRLDLDGATDLSFVDALLDREPNRLGTTFRQTLYNHTGGNPLFTLELLREMRNRGELKPDETGRWVDTRPDWTHLPARVEAVITERINRLSPDWQEMLNIASVEGVEFNAEVVAQVQDVNAAQVRNDLSGPLSQQHNLVRAVRVDWVGKQRLSRYRFAHHLFQTYLYQRQDPVKRAERHHRVGLKLAEQYAGHPAKLADLATALAWHFEAAGQIDRAISYLLRAGQEAQRLAAPAEAIAFYRRGLALLAQQPPSAERDRRELELLVGLEASIFTEKGWGVPESGEILQRAYALGQKLGEGPLMLPVLQALANVTNARADHRQALTFAQQLLALAERLNHPVYQAIGHRMVGISHFFFGDYPTARTHLEKSIALYPSHENEVDLPIPAGREEAIFSWMWLPQIFLLLGYPEQAVAYSRQTLAQARALDRTYPRIITSIVAGAIFYTVGNCPQETVAHAEQALAMLEDNPSSGYHGWATFYHGWGLAGLGEPETGLPLMTTGLAQLQNAGTQASMVHLYTLLAEVYGQLKQFDRGLELLAEALNLSEQTGARSFLAEIYRGRGELLVKQGIERAAESLFKQAIDVARQQQLRLWELRATVSLARLQQKQGRVAETRERLAAISGWFTEGFDMPDLQEARFLLEGMSSDPNESEPKRIFTTKCSKDTKESLP
ncbi:MAG: DUF2791 family P-loop domain-containing protein [Anaerolineae bacterium]|nr:DUF2791 family P-loop domain-containing protein [Anaerolineae bacterium]